MSVKYFKEGTRCFVVYDNNVIDITDIIEEEIQTRENVNKLLKEYFKDFSNEQMHDFYTLKVRHNTMKKYYVDIINKSEKFSNEWFKGSNCHGSALTLKNSLIISKKWLEQLDKEQKK